MAYRWVDHTAEVELEITAPTEAAIFADALRALGELIGDGPAGAPVTFDVEVAAPDRAVLLARWLDELVYRAETDGVVPEAAERLALGGDRVVATVRGRRGAPRPLVKGVTYHRLALAAADDGFRATVVLDV